MAASTYTSDAGSFFLGQQNNTSTTTAPITSQIDPSQPQVDGLTPVTDPIIPDRLTSQRLANMDPSQYDLRDTSHLMKFVKALIGSAGAGGVRKQALINRMSSTFTGSHYGDLDSFWGALFGVPRITTEQMPKNADGTTFNPMTDVTDIDTWDRIAGSDAQYRSRIMQFMLAINMGATYEGITMAAEAILGVDVDLTESWVLADQIPAGTTPSNLGGNSYFMVINKYSTYGAMAGKTWGSLAGGQQSSGQTPLGNRGEIVLQPKATITQEQKRIAQKVLDQLHPAGSLLTIIPAGSVVLQPIAANNYYSDSEDWAVVSKVTQYPGLNTVDEADIYPNQGQFTGARPAHSTYAGESWSYNGKVALVASYTLDAQGNQQLNAGDDWQTVTFLDGTTHSYTPDEAVMSAERAAGARVASDGVMTVYPYSPARAS